MHQRLRKRKRELNKSLVKQNYNSNFAVKNDNNELNTDGIDVAESFNGKFVYIRKTLTASIEKVAFTTDDIEINEKSLFFYPADCTEVSRIFKSLKNQKTPGLDRLTAEILKVNLFVKIEKFVYLLNESLKIGTFPRVLKTMRVVPIYKFGKKSRRENGRTISVLSVLGKKFERGNRAII